MKMSGALTKVLSWQCRGNTRNSLYMGKGEVKRKDSRLRGGGGGGGSSGFTNEQSPQCGAFSGDLLGQKSKSPLFRGRWGRGYK